MNRIWIEKNNNQHLSVYMQKGNKTESYFIKSLSGENLNTSFESIRIIASLVSLSKEITTLEVPGPIDDLLKDSIPLATELLNDFGNNSTIRNHNFNFSDICEIIESRPEEEESKNEEVKRVATFFTGGVDSFFTLFKNKSEITDIIFVHGLDIALEDKVVRKEISERLKKICAELNLKLIELETNLRSLYKNFNIHWELAHGNALGAFVHFLDNYFKKVYIPATFCYKDFFPWGSHPAIDYLWSTTKLEILHDGWELNRYQKIKCISNHNVVLENLNVCWINKSENINCGKCEKCQRTMICLSIVDKLKYCKTLPNNIKAEDLVINLETITKKRNRFFTTRMLYEELKKIKDLKNRGELFLIYKKIHLLFQNYYLIRKNL